MDANIIAGRLMDGATPANGDVLAWDAALGAWRPVTMPGGMTFISEFRGLVPGKGSVPVTIPAGAKYVACGGAPAPGSGANPDDSFFLAVHAATFPAEFGPILMFGMVPTSIPKLAAGGSAIDTILAMNDAGPPGPGLDVLYWIQFFQ